MQLLINENIEREKWNEIISLSSFSSPFQTLDFYNFFNSIEHSAADVFAVEEKKKLTSLVIITIHKEKGAKGYFSRRGIIYGGPLVIGTNENSLLFLFSELNKYYKRKLIYLEIRNSFDFNPFKEVFTKIKWNYNPHLNVQLPLQNRSLNDVLNLMTYNRRREIKMSFNEGAEVYTTASAEETLVLFSILKDLYLTKVRSPLPGKEYFLAFLNVSIAKVFVVKHAGNLIGGAFCITDNRTSINTLYYAGLRDYNKKIFPTHLAIIGVIKYAIENNIRVIDFMGAGKPDVPYGVRDFKLQFGGELVEHGRYLKILNPLLYNIGKMGLSILSKLKK